MLDHADIWAGLVSSVILEQNPGSYGLISSSDDFNLQPEQWIAYYMIANSLSAATPYFTLLLEAFPKSPSPLRVPSADDGMQVSLSHPCSKVRYRT